MHGVRLDCLDFLRHDADVERPARLVAIQVHRKAVVELADLLNVGLGANVGKQADACCAKLPERTKKTIVTAGGALQVRVLHLHELIGRPHHVQLRRGQARNQPKERHRALLVLGQLSIVVRRRLLAVAKKAHQVGHIGSLALESKVSIKLALPFAELPSKLILIDPVGRVRQLRLLPKLAVLQAEIRAKLPISLPKTCGLKRIACVLSLRLLIKFCATHPHIGIKLSLTLTKLRALHVECVCKLGKAHRLIRPKLAVGLIQPHRLQRVCSVRQTCLLPKLRALHSEVCPKLPIGLREPEGAQGVFGICQARLL
jgi:hypothetical protein